MNKIFLLMWAAVAVAFFLALFAFITRDYTPDSNTVSGLTTNEAPKDVLQNEAEQPPRMPRPTPTPIPAIQPLSPDVPVDTPKPSKLD